MNTSSATCVGGTEAGQQLRFVAADQDVGRLVLTERYWATQMNPTFSTPTAIAVRNEVQDRTMMLTGALKDTDDLHRRWSDAAPLTAMVVADTNVYLHHRDTSTNWTGTLRLVGPTRRRTPSGLSYRCW